MKRRTSALCDYKGMLCLVEFSKPKPTLMANGAVVLKPDKCPECKIENQGLVEWSHGWLLCNNCGFKILRTHHREILEYFASDLYIADEWAKEFELLPLGEDNAS